MTLTNIQYQEVLVRLGRNTKRPQTSIHEPCSRETGKGGLHERIIEHCNKQWPRWKFRHARTDRPTTEEKGVEDFTLFLPGNRTIHCECKSRDGKLSIDQQSWRLEMGLLGHEVHTVDSFEKFLEVVK